MLIERHASWLALNNVVGCPNNCIYCFLKERASSPKQICLPEEAVNQLILSELYDPQIPICIMPNTDAFSTPFTKRQLFKVCYLLKKRNIKNLITVITKREITERDAAIIALFRKKGLNILPYVSYSGLDATFEKGIRKRNQLEAIISMKNLKKHEVPCIHYWRPLIPQNSDKETLKNVLDIVSQYCFASCMTGLKLYKNMNCQCYWPEAQKYFDDGINPECFIPRNTFQTIIKLANNKNYPVFVDNICLLSQIQHLACTYGIYQSHRCLNYNLCSEEQKQKCGEYYSFMRPSQLKIDENYSLTKILETIKNKKVSIMHPKISEKTYWQSSFTSNEWLEL